MKRLFFTLLGIIFLVVSLSEVSATCAYPDCGLDCKKFNEMPNHNLGEECCPTYVSEYGTFFQYEETGICFIADGLEGRKNELEWCKEYLYMKVYEPTYIQRPSFNDYWPFLNWYWNPNDDGEVIDNLFDEEALLNYAGSLGRHPCDILFWGFVNSPRKIGASSSNYDYKSNPINIFGSGHGLIETNFFDAHGYGGQYGSKSKASGFVLSSSDPAGKLLEGVDAENNILKNYYDGAERLIRSEYYLSDEEEEWIENDFTVEYFYDEYKEGGSCVESGSSFNLLCEITDNSGKTKIRYDKRGRVTWQEKTIKDDVFGDRVYALEFLYDSADNVVEINLPDENKIFYDYNTLGQLIGVRYGANYENSEAISDFTYSSSGAIESKTLNPEDVDNNRIFANYFYDIKDQVKTIFFSKFESLSEISENIFFQRGLTYDLVGNVLGISYDVDVNNPLEFQSGAEVESFGYDNLYRISSSRYPDGAGFEYTYLNLLGDRGSKIIKENDQIMQEISYEYWPSTMALKKYNINGEELGIIMGYDDNGNLNSFVDEFGDRYEYIYDSLNRVVEVQKNYDYSSPLGIYIYDYTNARIKKKTNTKTTFYLYQGNNVIYEESIYNYICGDASNDGYINILDVTYLINYLYKGGSPPEPLAAGDIDGSGRINILDATYLVNYLYKGGSAPVCSSSQPLTNFPDSDKGDMTLEEIENYLNNAR